MGVVGEKLDIDFVISTGDNIYDDGIANTSDPLFKECFTNIYTAQSLQKPWYIGNGLYIYMLLDHTNCCVHAKLDPVMYGFRSSSDDCNARPMPSLDLFLIDRKARVLADPVL